MRQILAVFHSGFYKYTVGSSDHFEKEIRKKKATVTNGFALGLMLECKEKYQEEVTGKIEDISQ